MPFNVFAIRLAARDFARTTMLLPDCVGIPSLPDGLPTLREVLCRRKTVQCPVRFRKIDITCCKQCNKILFDKVGISIALVKGKEREAAASGRLKKMPRRLLYQGYGRQSQIQGWNPLGLRLCIKAHSKGNSKQL
jgi:hypothetical protein